MNIQLRRVNEGKLNPFIENNKKNRASFLKNTFFDFV